MSLEATAEALATDTAMPVAEAPAMSEDDILDAAFDRMQETEEQDDPTPIEPEVDEAETGDETPEDDAETVDDGEEAPEPVEAPSELPKSIKDAWKDIPEAAREAIVESQREANRKLSEQGRLVQGIAPIRDVLVEAAKQLPSLANMRPAEVASEVMELARMSHAFNTQPVQTLMGLVQKHGLQDAMKQALDGQPISQEAQGAAALKQEIASLKRQLAQVSDPEYLRSHVQAFTTESQTQNEVHQFAAQAEHWDKVEAYVPHAIPIARAKLGEGASPRDVLSAAYDLAVSQFVPQEPKAPSRPAAAEAAIDAPEKTEAARKAKSVNVTSRPSGSPKKMTVDEALEDAWRRVHNS